MARRCGRLGLLGAVAAGLIAAAVPARADPADAGNAAGSGTASGADDGESVAVRPGVLPQIGASLAPSATEPDGGDLRDLLTGAGVASGTAAQPGWNFAPAIDINQEVDDGAADSAGATGRVFVTTLQPSIALSANTTRVQAQLSYAPAVLIYAGNGGTADSAQDRVAQNLEARALVTVLPSTLFVDLRGYGGEQSRFGGAQPSSSTALYSDDATQNYSFSASPYLLQRFDGKATAEIGYSIADSLQDSDAAPSGASPIDGIGGAQQAMALDDIANQRLLSQTAHLALVTGEDFGRYTGSLLASATKLDGSGVLDHAYRNLVTLDNDYTLRRGLTLLTRVGYEDISYSGTNPLGIHDPVWDVGVRYSPRADVNATIRYGHHDGFNSLTVSASVAPTARLQLFADYSSGLSTGLEDLQNGVALSDLDPEGNPVDHASGTPLYVADSFAGAQAGLYKLRRLSAGIRWLYDRDALWLSLDREQRTLLSSPTALVAALDLTGSNTQTSGSASWRHELSPSLSAVASVQYGIIDGQPAFFGVTGTTDTLSATLSLDDAISDTVSLTVLYGYTSNDEQVLSLRLPDTAANRVLIGLRKTF